MKEISYLLGGLITRWSLKNRDEVRRRTSSLFFTQFRVGLIIYDSCNVIVGGG